MSDSPRTALFRPTRRLRAMARRCFAIFGAAICAAFVLAAELAHAAPVRVAASTPAMASVARAIGGEHVNVTVLSAANEDPHFVEPKPSLLLKLNRAQLLVFNGVELEAGWLPRLQINARNPKIVSGVGVFDASMVVPKLEVPSGRVDRSQGDVHAGGNPHYVLSPNHMALVGEALAQRLGQLDPKHADAYAAAGAAWVAQVRGFAQREAARWRNKLTPAQRQLVVYHRSMKYLLQWLGVREVAAIEPKPGIPPNPAHVATVLNAMRARKASVIVQEAYYPRTTSQTLARMAGATLITIPGGPELGKGETYLDYVRGITTALFAALAQAPGEAS